MVAANVNARITVARFALFSVASIAWLGDGLLEGKSSLVFQNALLLLANILGRLALATPAEKEAKSAGHKRADSLIKD